MTMKKIALTAAFAVAVTSSIFSQSKATDLIGEWWSPKKDTRFQIYQQENLFFGKIVWGTGTQTKDVKNPDENLRNQEVIGLIMLKNFRFDGKYSWTGGTIYDPREGKRYDCIITMNDYNKISVRGYIGISLFGRSELWTRAN
jgi:uncharacterized protein (DUF2147 family)